VREQHQPAVERDRRHLVPPERVRQHHHREAEARLAEAERLQDAFGHLLRRLAGERLRFVQRPAERFHRGADAVADGAVLRHLLERRRVQLRRLRRRALAGGFRLGVGDSRHSVASCFW
jgi:hypothetical protein